MEAATLPGGVDSFQPREAHLLVVGKAHAVAAQQPYHAVEVGFDVLGRIAQPGLAEGKGRPHFLRFATEAADGVDHLAERYFARLDALDSERAADARHAPDGFRLIDQFLLLGVGGDAGVDLIHLGTPRLPVGRHGCGDSGRPIGVGIEGDRPVLPGLPLVRQLPAAAVGAGDGPLALGPLFVEQFQRQAAAQVIGDGCQGRVAGREFLFEDRFVPAEDRIEVGVLGDALEGDVGNGLVAEAARDAGAVVAEAVVVELGGEQALPGDGDGNAAGVDGDPASAPLLGDLAWISHRRSE